MPQKLDSQRADAFRKVEPVFGLLKPNPESVEVPEHDILAHMFETSEDVSQLGLVRNKPELHLQGHVGGNMVAYIRPKPWALLSRDRSIVAARVRVLHNPSTIWSDEAKEQVQEMLRPRDELTEDQIDVTMARADAEAKVAAKADIRAAKIRRVINAVLRDAADKDAKALGEVLATVGVNKGDFLPANYDVTRLPFEALEISVAASIDIKMRVDETRAVNEQLGLVVYAIDPDSAIAMEPYATALAKEKDRQELGTIPAVMNQYVTNVSKEDATMVTLEVLRASDIEDDDDNRDDLIVETTLASAEELERYTSVEATWAVTNNEAYAEGDDQFRQRTDIEEAGRMLMSGDDDLVELARAMLPSARVGGVNATRACQRQLTELRRRLTNVASIDINRMTTRRVMFDDGDDTEEAPYNRAIFNNNAVTYSSMANISDATWRVLQAHNLLSSPDEVNLRFEGATGFTALELPEKKANGTYDPEVLRQFYNNVAVDKRFLFIAESFFSGLNAALRTIIQRLNDDDALYETNATTSERAYINEAVRYIAKKRELDAATTTVVKMPAEDVDYIDVIADGNYNKDMADELDGGRDWSTLTGVSEFTLAGMVKYVLGCYALRFVDQKNAKTKATAAYLTSRAEVLDRRMYLAGVDVNVHDAGRRLVGYTTAAIEKQAVIYLSEGRVGPIGSVLVHHSFMKSGHHISAAGLGLTFMRMGYSILGTKHKSFDFSPTEVAEVLGSGIYPGFHVADQRLTAIIERRKAANQQTSFSFARRLIPEGPGIVAHYLLNQVMESLNETGFFEVIKKQTSYDIYSSLYKEFRAKCWQETPYANFMFGVSRHESKRFKGVSAKFMGYAAALEKFMPDSSYNFSVALKRDASMAAANTLTAGLEVQAFVSAYRTHLHSIVQGEVARRAQRARRGITSAEAAMLVVD